MAQRKLQKKNYSELRILLRSLGQHVTMMILKLCLVSVLCKAQIEDCIFLPIQDTIVKYGSTVINTLELNFTSIFLGCI